MTAQQLHRQAVLFSLFALASLAQILAPAPAIGQSKIPRENLWFPNGPVNAIVPAEGKIYLGGNFSYIGPPTGGWVPIGLDSGKLPASFPKINGTVTACVADGAGGWFIGGEFTRVGSVPRKNIAHILPDGSLDVTKWGSISCPGKVNALACSSWVLYAAHTIEQYPTEPLCGIRAYNLTNGQTLNWYPKLFGAIRALAASDSGDTLYMGGEFTIIQGKDRKFLAALQLSSDQPTDWNPSADSAVHTLAISGTTLYVGGKFTNISGQPRNRIAALELSSGEAKEWNPNATLAGFTPTDCRVDALAVSGSTIYAGGAFTRIGGESRSNLAALDAGTTGPTTSWNPSANAPVYALNIFGATVYAGGAFTSIGGQPRNHLAALSTESGSAIEWNPNVGGDVLAIGISGPTLYAGGNFVSVGGITRNNLAALDSATGEPTDWNPDPNGSVSVLTLSGRTIYAGGYFTTVGLQARNCLAAIDTSSGYPTPWNPDVRSVGTGANVATFALSSSTLYVGGSFSSVGLQTRHNIAALDLSSGLPTSWNPERVDGQVRALALSGSTLYIGGWFIHVGSLSRKNLAAIDTVTAAATAWDPSADFPVETFALSGSTLYAGGAFSSIGGQTRKNIAAINIETGLATSWNPNINTFVKDIAISEFAGRSTVYLAAAFIITGGHERSFIAAIDSESGRATPWNPEPNYVVNVIALANPGVENGLYIGGSFTSVGEHLSPYFAQFEHQPLAAKNWSAYR